MAYQSAARPSHGDTMNKSKMKPGIHFMQGDRVLKSITLTGDEGWTQLFGGDGRTQTADALVASVGYVFIAVGKRRQNIISIDVGWEKNGERGTPPFTFPIKQLLYRIDPAMQLLGVAYLHKQRRGNRFLGVKWQDPRSIHPDKNSLTADGYERYTKNTTRGPQPIPADDIIRFIDPMFSEHDPGPTAGAATSLAAQVLLGMSETADTVFDTNGLPVIAVVVPEETTDPDKEDIRNRFERVFRRGRSRKGNKTIGIRESVEIKTISLAPKDLAMTPLSNEKREEIALAHDVPPAILWSDVNTNQAGDKWQQFINALGVRALMIAETVNDDDDIKASGWRMVVDVNAHWAMKADEANAALTVTRYATVMKPRAALHLMGIDMEKFPEDWTEDDVFLPAIAGAANVPTGESAETDTAKAAELSRLRRYVKKGNHKKRPFQSDILTQQEIDEVAMRSDASFQSYRA